MFNVFAPSKLPSFSFLFLFLETAKLSTKLFKDFMATFPCVVVGPFGGYGGLAWNDGLYTTVISVTIRHGEKIDAIQIEYDDNGESKLCPWHGNGENYTESKVELQYPDEYITNISGHFGTFGDVVIVRSLTIESNMRKYGPFGVKVGEHFSTSVTGGKIVGFLGRSGWYLDAIGASFVPQDLISVGPFGGLGGDKFDDGTYKRVTQIHIRHADVLESIQVVYEDDGGQIHWSDVHGTIGGGTVEEVILEEDEYLTSISGYYKALDSHLIIIHSITFHSNIQNYGPFGVEEGKHFSTSTTDGKIIGFLGSSDIYINSIGAYFAPVPLLSK